MRIFHPLALAVGLVLTAMSASAQTTAYGYTMYPATSPAMISFDIQSPSSTTRLGTYSKAEPRSGALVGNTLYMMGVDDDFNVWFYSMNTTTGEDQTIKKVGEVSTPADMSYDYSTNTMYFVSNSPEVDGVSAIGTIDMENGKETFVQDLAYYCKALAIDARGQMYVLTNSGFLLKVNKSSGETVVIGSTGLEFASWMSFHSMEFDRKTGTLYLAAWTKNEKTVLYTLSTTTGEATLIGTLGDGTHTIALGIPYAPADGNAPDRVSDATISPDKSGALYATLTWTNPVNDYNSTPLDGTISIEIVNTVTGEKTVIEDCQPGETMQREVEVGQAGMYAYDIAAVNEAGASVEVTVEAWIGPDVPAAVGDASAKHNPNRLLVNDLSWTTPTIGAHGGYLDKRTLKYDIVRLNDGKTIAQNVSGTSFSDVNLLDDLTRYSYQITAKNSEGTGETIKTNDLVNGPAVECPYIAPFNSWQESGQYWTVIDGNQDKYPFVWYNDFMNMFGQGYNKGYYIYQKHETNYAYDFIVSPPILFTEGHEYKVTATVSNDDIAGYREESFSFYNLRCYELIDPLPLGEGSFTVKHPGEFRDYSLTFKVEDDGYGAADDSFPSFIALCCNSNYDMGMLLVSKMMIEDITPDTPVTGDVNSDGEVNISDINALIDMILSGNADVKGDINSDHEVNVSDINALINIILNQ